MSSLIFVVILAVWAVYLVQHWVRRRDHLATARSVDRFSEAMRVLERRRALPRPEVAEQAQPSYSLSPLRPARPEVVVKPHAAGATAVAPSPGMRRARQAAQVRAAALLLASVAMVTLVALSAGQLMHWGWSFAGVGILAATLLLVRRSVAADQARRQLARRRAAAPSRAGASSSRAAGPSRSGATARSGRAAAGSPERHTSEIEHEDSPLAAQARAATAARPARRAVDLQPVAGPRATAVYDVAAVEAALIPVVLDEQPVEEVYEEPAPGSWSPTPVPPPTYTLKAKAYRGVAQDPTGSQQLPADGTEMALEEEFEELPRIERVV